MSRSTKLDEIKEAAYFACLLPNGDFDFDASPNELTKKLDGAIKKCREYPVKSRAIVAFSTGIWCAISFHEEDEMKCAHWNSISGNTMMDIFRIIQHNFYGTPGQN